MSIKNWSVTPASNSSAPPAGAPESSTKLKDVNDILREVMAKVRCLAAPVTIASAATTDLGASDETITTVSGIVTITGFGTVSSGIYKLVTFSGALTLTHNATSLILLGGANRTTVAGDCGLYVSLGGGNWKEYFYSPIAAAAAYQPLDAELTTLAGITAGGATNLTTLAGITAQQASDLASTSAFMGTVLNDVDQATARATLGAKSSALDNAFSACSAVNQTVVAATYTKITFGTEEFDLSNTFATSRFTPNVAGYYQLNFIVTGDTNIANGLATCSLYKNGGTSAISGSRQMPPIASNTASVGSCVVYLNGTTDYVEVFGYIDGVTISGAFAFQTRFSGFRIG